MTNVILKTKNNPPILPTLSVNNLREVIDKCCKENVNGKEIKSIGLTTLDMLNDEKGDGKSNETSDGKSNEFVHLIGKSKYLKLLDENNEGFELFENCSLDLVKLVEVDCGDKLDEIIVGGYDVWKSL
ncbi:hypothetical protein Tco_0773178 [Tanacetum coccineum]|uniref:Uncharacterized protein n=1 Tax=Tanacetum coccineum TaxID=301880 RepID=A0ABQ4ZL08_9ASTR